MKNVNAIGSGIGVLCISAVVLIMSAAAARAAEQGGLLVDIQKKVSNRSDRNTPNGVGSMNVDRTMSLKVDVKNNASRLMPETKIAYIVLIQRWASESGNIERYEGTGKLEGLGVSHSTSVVLGDFAIGGHMHGTSDMHVDKMVAWKIVIERDGKKLEFTNTSTFDALNTRARPGAKKGGN